MGNMGTAELDLASLAMREDGNRRRVLYAEDQTTTRMVTAAMLERMGFEVVAVEDGELALAEAKLSAYDLILLDIEMPIMDGVTAARSIRAEAVPCMNTPILALSAFLADSTEHSVWRDAFDSALPKPATGRELHKAMKSVIQQRPQVAKPVAGSAMWHEFGSKLPPGTLLAITQAARDQMEHLVLALASCIEAADRDSSHTCINALKALADSFTARELAATIDGMDKKLTVCETHDLLDAIAAWHKRQSIRH